MLAGLSRAGGGSVGGLDIYTDLLWLRDQSKNGGIFDIKQNLGPNEGYLLNGKYVTGRSAGNYLAGRNAALAKPVLVPRGMWWKETIRRAGRLHSSQNGTPMVAPWFGEIPYAGRRVRQGFNSVR